MIEHRLLKSGPICMLLYCCTTAAPPIAFAQDDTSDTVGGYIQLFEEKQIGGVDRLIQFTNEGFMLSVSDPHNMLTLVESSRARNFYIDQLDDSLAGEQLKAVRAMMERFELSRELKLRCTALLHRAKQPTSWTKEMVREEPDARMILVVAENETWRSHMETRLKQRWPSREFLMAMVAWEGSDSLEIIQNQYRGATTASDYALALAMRGEKAFDDIFADNLEDVTLEETFRLDFAAALALLDDERGVVYLKEALQREQPGMGAWRYWVVRKIELAQHPDFEEPILGLIKQIRHGQFEQRHGESTSSVLRAAVDALIAIDPQRALTLLRDEEENPVFARSRLPDQYRSEALVKLYHHLPKTSLPAYRAMVGEEQFEQIRRINTLPYVPKELLPEASRKWAPELMDVIIPRLSRLRE